MADPVSGLQELHSRLHRVRDHELDSEMQAIHVELAREVLAKAEPNVPVGKTGRLKASLRAAGTVRDAIGRVGKASVPYAPGIHWGWPARGIRSRPFLQDASAAIERDVTDRYDRQVAEMFDRVIGR